MNESWKTAVYDGIIYKGLYKVSNWGRILSLNYRNTGKAELMNPGTDTNGYLEVGLSKNGETKKCLVHRLVAFTFLENPENKPEVNHKDENKTNNFVFLNEDGTVNKEKSNLEWKTHKDNINHGTHNERSAKTRSKSVLQFTLTGDLIREWESTQECGRNGFNQGAVAACCRGEISHYKGFLWMYTDDYKEKQLKEIEQSRQYYQKNREKELERRRQRYQKNRDKILEQKRQHYQKNRDKILEQRRQRYQRKKLEKQLKEVVETTLF